MPLTLSTFDPVLKDFWEPGIKEQLNQDIPLFRLLETTEKTFSGRRCIYPIHTTRNSGVGARAEAATLPTAGQQGHELAVVSATYQYGTIRISGQTLAAGKHAWAEALSMEMDGLVKDCKVDWGRQTWGDGQGRLAQIATSATAGSGSVVVPVFNRFQVPIANRLMKGQPGARFISVGMVVDIGSIANGTDEGSQTVSSVAVSSDPATTTDSVTLGNSACGFSSSEQFLYNRGAGGSGGVGLEFMGMQAIVDVFTATNFWGSNSFWTANRYGISQGVTAWQANVLANSGTLRNIDSFLMQQACDQLHIDTGEEANLIMGHHGVVRALFDSLVADRRYASTVFEGGYQRLTYNGIPVEKDRMAPYHCLLVAKKEALQKFVLKDMGFEDRDGAILSRVSGQDNFDGFFSYYMNLGVVGNMKSLLMIRDIRTDL